MLLLTWTWLTVEAAGWTRRALLFVPPKPEAALFLFHGGGGTARGMARLARMEEVTDRFLLVYPEARRRRWGVLPPRDRADLAFIRRLVEEIRKEYRLDTFFCAGMSNGGQFCLRWTVERAPFRAYGIVASLPSPQTLRQGKADDPRPILFILGSEDPIIPIQGGEVRIFGRTRGVVWSLEETLRYWKKRNHCKDPPSERYLPDIADDGLRTLHRVWPCRAPLELYLTEGGGHAWPGGIQYLPPRIIGRTTRDFSASRVLVSFFQQFVKREPSSRSSLRLP